MADGMCVTLRIRYTNGRPFIETRARSLGKPAELIPRGKVLVVRTPVLPPGASEEAVRRGTRMLIEDDGTSGAARRGHRCSPLLFAVLTAR